MAITSIEDLRQVLKDSPAVEEIVGFVNAQVEAEKQQGIATHRKANNEAQGLRKWKTAMETVGYQGEPDGIEEWLAEKTKAQPEKKGGPDPEIEKLRREFKKAQEALIAEQQKAAAIKAASDKRLIKARLSESLRDNMHAYDLLADSLINDGRVRLTEDERVVFVDGDNEIDYEVGLKKLRESRPDLMKNTQAPGARSNGRPVQGTPVYTFDRLRGMTQAEMVANMADIDASLKAQKGA